MAIAVMAETKSFVNFAEPLTRRFAVEAQIPAVKSPVTLDRLTQHRGRNHATGESPRHGESMNKGGFRLGHIRPEQSIFQLKLDRARNFPIAFGYIKESVCHVIRNASGRQ